MSTATATLPETFNEAAFEAFLARRDDPNWIVERRKQAFEIYRERHSAPLDPEEWKRIDLRAFRPEKYSLQTDRAEGRAIETLLADRAEFAGQVTHENGTCLSSQFQSQLADKGIVFGDLSSLVHTHRELLEPYFMTRAVTADRDRFSAWHAAFWTGGTVLYVPPGVSIDAPLYSLIALSRNGAADFSHTLIILGDRAAATLLEETASADDASAGLHVGSVELIVGKEANLRYVQLQNWNQKTYHFAHQAGRVERDGYLQWTVGGLGSKLAHIHQDVVLDGPGARGEVNGVTFATDKQLISYYTQQTHNSERTESDLLYKEVLRDKSRVIWRGMIKVEKIAQLTDGYQRSDALMLSDTARCDAIPGLEIEADDVRCTHGATAGQVDEEQVFYAMSRGINRYEAMHMIVEGFFQQVYDRIPVEVVRETLSQAVERKLGFGD
jgi:Fe-S cluster assembly protein SufD